jgi:hypothetical protein
VPIAGKPELADALVGVGDVHRTAITAAMTDAPVQPLVSAGRHAHAADRP